MPGQFVPVDFAVIAPDVKLHLARLPSVIDSFLEDHILRSIHFRITLGEEDAGFASVYDESLITQFSLFSPYRQHGQELFWNLRRVEQVRSAFVPTCDELFLSHALDDYRSLAKQAYFFASPQETTPAELDRDYSLLLASSDDLGFVRAESGDFFVPVERSIAAGELYLTFQRGEPVGFGLMVRGALYDDVASIGMFTIGRFRRQGVGAATIALLLEECRRQRLRAVAGCWYYNHRSKRTLERAGMHSPTRLLRVEF